MSEVKRPLDECVKCGGITCHDVYIREDAKNYPNWLTAQCVIYGGGPVTQRVLCPRCTLKVMEEKFGRLG